MTITVNVSLRIEYNKASLLYLAKYLIEVFFYKTEYSYNIKYDSFIKFTITNSQLIQLSIHRISNTFT